MTTLMPTDSKPIKLYPDLAEAVEAMLAKVPKNRLDDARAAVVKVYHSGITGTFSKIRDAYQTAIDEAVA